MKILLLHEMSGVHTELKNGLIKLGVHVDIATYGDGWKKYKSDIHLGKTDPSISSHIERLLRQTLLINRIKSYDVIQLISPNPFYRPISPILEKLIFNNDRKIVYIAAGSDAIYRKYVKQLKYYPPHNWEESHNYRDLKNMLELIDHVVPVCWEYEYCMQQAGVETEPLMPFPIDLSRFHPKKLATNKKIVIFHPLNRTDLRYDFKGTLIIQKAFERLRKKHGDAAEFICAGGMPHSEYEKLTERVDIIVDQAYSYSYGMSAAYGLANGKVVLSGMEERARVMHYTSSPIINIKPDVDDIENKIDALIRNRKQIQHIGEQSRAFAEAFHCNLKVAERFLEIYNKANEAKSN